MNIGAPKFAGGGRYMDTYVLIDTGSKYSVFNNRIMLLNIRSSKKKLRAYTTGGYQDSKQVGNFKTNVQKGGCGLATRDNWGFIVCA